MKSTSLRSSASNENRPTSSCAGLTQLRMCSTARWPACICVGAAHAAADVEQDAQADRALVAGLELDDLTQAALLEHLEVVTAEVANRPASLVLDDGGDRDEVDGGAERRGLEALGPALRRHADEPGGPHPSPPDDPSALPSTSVAPWNAPPLPPHLAARAATPLTDAIAKSGPSDGDRNDGHQPDRERPDLEVRVIRLPPVVSTTVAAVGTARPTMPIEVLMPIRLTRSVPAAVLLTWSVTAALATGQPPGAASPPARPPSPGWRTSPSTSRTSHPLARSTATSSASRSPTRS